MNHEARIVDAFKSNSITRTLLIDDAYDPPSLNDEIMAAFAEFLASEDGTAACVECGVSTETREAATNDAEEGNGDSNALAAAYQAIYEAFARTGEERFDPDGWFDTTKAPGLALLRPLRSLLCRCGDNIDVRVAGRENGTRVHDDFRPQLVFIDYYLDEGVTPMGEVSSDLKRSARKTSITVLKEIVGRLGVGHDVPAIVLMSSRDINDVETYRHKIGARKVLSLRFLFLKKETVRQQGESIVIEPAAADTLLDISQGYLFGKVLQDALFEWKKGADAAFQYLLKMIGDLQTKDFAYLVRFRLREEGQPFSEYLEWFLGECLKGFIAEKVAWRHKAFLELSNAEGVGKSIEGAFDGPSVNIAELFHHVRIEAPGMHTRGGYRLGDLYVELEGFGVRAVITPDCDLVERKGRTKAGNVLTMKGELNTFDKSAAVADDLVLRNGTAYSVQWKPKDLDMFPVEGAEALHNTEEFEFLGTLRPLYAQEMQRRALTDLSRIGLPVAPAMGIDAAAEVWVRKKTRKSSTFVRIEMSTPAIATIIPSRTGEMERRGHRVLLRRRFFGEMIDRLRALDRSKMHEGDVVNLEKILSGKTLDGLYEGVLGVGRFTADERKSGIGFILGDRPSEKRCSAWLQIVLKTSTECMEALETVDPLA